MNRQTGSKSSKLQMELFDNIKKTLLMHFLINEIKVTGSLYDTLDT